MTAIMVAQSVLQVVGGGDDIFIMVADFESMQGVSGFDIGGNFGTVNPTQFRDDDIREFLFSESPDQFVFRWDASEQVQTAFTKLAIFGTDWDEELLTADAATFSTNGSTRWFWDLPGHAHFVLDDSYIMTLS